MGAMDEYVTSSKVVTRVQQDNAEVGQEDTPPGDGRQCENEVMEVPGEGQQEKEDEVDASQPQVRCAPSGTNWVIDATSLACACGMLIKRKRVGEHIQSCSMTPSPLAKVLNHRKEVCTVKKVGADRLTCCLCGKNIKASARDVSWAKAMNRHLSKEHQKTASRERLHVRRRSFNDSHFLVAKTIAVAVSTGLLLEAGAFTKMMEEQQRHGSSQSQATAETSKDAQEEHLLRSSLNVHPEPQPLFLSNGLYSEYMSPSRTSMKHLEMLERRFNLPIVDWRQIIAVAEPRRRVRETLSQCYNKSAGTSYVCGHSVRRYLDFIRGHLAEVEGGADWKPLVAMLRDLVNTVMKEHAGLVTKAQGRRETKYMTEERIDHPTRVEDPKSIFLENYHFFT